MHPDAALQLTTPLFVASVALLVGVVAWAVLAPWWRSVRLSRTQRPNREELEVVRTLRRPGAIQLGGRTARRTAPDAAGGGDGGGCYEPTLAQSWRKRRGSAC